MIYIIVLVILTIAKTQTCNPPCATCSTAGTINGYCLSCLPGYNPFPYYLNPTVGNVFTCISSDCGPGSFRNPIATPPNFNCPSCNPACDICYGPYNNNCAQCRDGYYRYDFQTCLQCSGNCIKCVNDPTHCIGCKPKTFSTLITPPGVELCTNCHISCASCLDATPTGCLSCAPTKYFFTQIDATLHTGTCTSCFVNC